MVFQVGRGGFLSNTLGETMRPDHLAQGFVQTGLENLQGWRLHNLSRQSVPPLTVLTGRKCFPVPSLNPSGFNVWSLLVLPPCKAEQSLAPSSPWPPSKYQGAALQSPPTCFSSWLNKPWSHSLSSVGLFPDPCPLILQGLSRRAAQPGSASPDPCQGSSFLRAVLCLCPWVKCQESYEILATGHPDAGVRAWPCGIVQLC